MNDQPKKMLSYDEMITKLKDKGITFNIMSEREATDFLRDNNYFFKLISYRVNFKKDTLTDKYIDLDFAYLVDLAAIDAAIRRFLSPITLNVEHGCKVRILKKITENDEIDGYNIVNKLKLSDNSYSRKAYEKTIDFLKENQYETKLYNNYKNNIPIWVLIESMTFGALTQFWNFYRDEYAPGSSDVKTLSVHLQSAKKFVTP